MKGEVRSIINNCIALTYFGRGAITYSEMMEMTPYEKGLINDFQNERITMELKNPHPNY